MKNTWFIILLICVVSIQFACWPDRTDARNYRDAYLVMRNDSAFIKLSGKRVPIHGPGTYEDSTLIPIVTFREGKIYGNEIPTKEGYYKYTGYLSIDSDKLEVKLYIDNTDDHVTSPDTWNGNYNLIK